MICRQCQSEVVEGPEGGYACGQCTHTVEPDGYAERREAGLARAREARQAKALARTSNPRRPSDG